MINSHRKSFAFLFTAALFTWGRSAYAVNGGITGYTGRFGANETCAKATCHSGGSTPTVSLAGPATLAAGATGTYTLTITTGAARTGFNIDGASTANLGAVTLAQGKIAIASSSPGTQTVFDEVTHTAGSGGGNKTITFTATAPASGVTAFRIFAAGLAGNGGNGKDGDGTATTTYNVTVTGGGTPPVDAGSPDTGSPGSDAGVKPDGATPPADGGTTPVSDSGAGVRDSGGGGNVGTDSGSTVPGGGGVGGNNNGEEEEDGTPTSSDAGCSAAPTHDAASSYAGTLMAGIGALVFSFGRRKKRK